MGPFPGPNGVAIRLPPEQQRAEAELLAFHFDDAAVAITFNARIQTVAVAEDAPVAHDYRSAGACTVTYQMRTAEDGSPIVEEPTFRLTELSPTREYHAEDPSDGRTAPA